MSQVGGAEPGDAALGASDGSPDLADDAAAAPADSGAGETAEDGADDGDATAATPGDATAADSGDTAATDLGDSAAPPCATNDDCTPLGKLCDPKSGACVQCLQDIDCPAADHCAPVGPAQLGACLPDVCAPGQKVCQGDPESQASGIAECSSNGSGFGKPTACGAQTTCTVAGGQAVCQPWVCQPGPGCASGKAVICAPTGLAVQSTEDCAAKGQVCASGACVAPVCDPQNPLFCDGTAAMKCDPSGLSATVVQLCGGDTVCSKGACVKQVCQPGAPPYCDGATIKQCDPSGLAVATVQTCGAGSYCSQGACVAQVCTPNTKGCNGSLLATCNGAGSGWLEGATNCAAQGNPCLTGICQAGACSTVPASPGGPCDDGNPCTAGDSCSNGKCAGLAKNCSALDAGCVQGVCEAGTCVAKALTSICNDANPCTVGDVCKGGQCIGTPMDCSNLNTACLVGVCAAGSCTAKPKASACDDGNPCTVADSCAAGGCQGSPMNCSSLNGPCSAGTCQGGKCIAQPASGGTGCDDGNPCTVADVCASGKCAGTAKDCSSATTACGPGVCDPATAKCVASPANPVCTPGQVDTATQACGKCGQQTRSRTCQASCGWGAWSGWSACGGEGACSPGEADVQHQGCGNCGQQARSRLCSATCQWGAWSNWGTCGSQGVCAPGATAATCGDPCAVKVCNSSCQWGACGLKAGAQCLFKNGGNFQCCGTKKWQFCNSDPPLPGAPACAWFPCLPSTQACF
ncbi:MAG: hypothetical protein HY902_00845 [Deltaproteobacteria bacterium]|nr:hypothetical protein [Deltaproteobacteria bacterium]